MTATRLEGVAAARRLLELSDADATEVIAVDQRLALTRFANSEIHQNVMEENSSLRVRVLDADRTGVASTNRLDDQGLREALSRARQAAAAQVPEGGMPAMAGPSTVSAPPVVAATANSTAEERAGLVETMCTEAERRGVLGFGFVSAGVTTYTVANSRGLELTSPRSIASVRMSAMGTDGASGYGGRTSQSIDELEVDAVAAEAVDRAVRHRDPITLDPGAYPVVMEEEAVGELLEYLSEIGFGALAVEEGRTFMHPGERITGEAINIWDDGLDPSGLPLPFDMEGVPRRRVDLVSGGVATAVVHDLATAARAGVSPTGHGLPAPNPWGPQASNLFIGGGQALDKTALCAGIERGVWVTRLWYVNIVDPNTSTLTGMTRDGTFLIEDGQVTRPVKNMRFTQSIMDAFGTCSAATRETRLVAGADYDYVAAYRVPAMRLDAFNFTSATR